ncbi:MAG: hypothetical protein KDA31_13485 [Phycisphaerales bacterium]|nr:hypothetical protein [Phycisphaerales bacterium]MCB9837384.1 hypothetical protein [Phycisphaera sp.]
MKRESGLNMNVLWVTAIALAALVILQLGRGGSAPFEQQALAEMVANVGDYSIMTTDGGNEELLFVLDNRNEQLLVYKVDQQRVMVLLAREELDGVFAAARSKLGGR